MDKVVGAEPAGIEAESAVDHRAISTVVQGTVPEASERLDEVEAGNLVFDLVLGSLVAEAAARAEAES